MLVDVHAHLEFDTIKEQLDAVLARAKAVGVTDIITAGSHPGANRDAISIAEQHPGVHVALGLYPDQIGADTASELAFIRHQEIVAIGECGLDFHITDDREKHETQKDLFRAQIRLAHELNLPLIVHSRKAEEACLDILEEMDAKKVVMHCFEGNKKLIERAVSMGYYVTATPNIARAEQVQLRVAMTPLRQLLTETDSPFLGPKREETNEPANVTLAVQGIAQIKSLTEEECANIIYINYRKLF